MPVLSLDVAGLLMDTDANTDTATVNRVKAFEFRLVLMELSSPHHTQPLEHRNLWAQIKLCLEGKGFVRVLVASPLHRPSRARAHYRPDRGRVG